MTMREKTRRITEVPTPCPTFTEPPRHLQNCLYPDFFDARKIDSNIYRLLLAIFSVTCNKKNDFNNICSLLSSCENENIFLTCLEHSGYIMVVIIIHYHHRHHHLQSISRGWSHYNGGKREEMLKDFVSFFS